MRLIKIMENDVVDCCSGICVSIWVSGCPHRCNGCHNSEYWDSNVVPETDNEIVLKNVLEAINKNGIMRNLSLLGGEPLYDNNLDDYLYIVKEVKKVFPDIKIYCWTGYVLENFTDKQKEILNYIDVLIDGPFILEKKDLTLKLRGSTNQRIFRKVGNKFVKE